MPRAIRRCGKRCPLSGGRGAVPLAAGPFDEGAISTDDARPVSPGRMPAVPAGALTRGVGCGMAVAPTLGAYTGGRTTGPVTGGENTRPAAGGEKEPTAGAATAGGGATCGVTAGATATPPTGAPTPPPALPAWPTAPCGTAARMTAAVKIRSPKVGNARLLACVSPLPRKIDRAFEFARRNLSR